MHYLITHEILFFNIVFICIYQQGKGEALEKQQSVPVEKEEKKVTEGARKEELIRFGDDQEAKVNNRVINIISLISKLTKCFLLLVRQKV